MFAVRHSKKFKVYTGNVTDRRNSKLQHTVNRRRELEHLAFLDLLQSTGTEFHHSVRTGKVFLGVLLVYKRTIFPEEAAL